jgi:hypothetical protein
MSKESEERATCRQWAARARSDERMYQRAAANAPDEAVKDWNQKRADSARETADTYERWLKENR